MCSCIIINKNIKLIDNCIFIGDRKICSIPLELRELLIKKNPRITINSANIFINEWEFKNNEFRKTFRGYIHKWLNL